MKQDNENLPENTEEIPVRVVIEPPTDECDSTSRVESKRWPSPPDDLAYHGLAGEYVRRIAPHTEADRVALLAQFLIAFGNLVGRHPHFTADGSPHRANLFAVVVGQSAKARKGTSWSQICRIFERVAPSWSSDHIVNGLSSGEGLIHAIRDPVEKMEPKKHKGNVVGYEKVIADPGIADKRLLVVEGEFANVLRVMRRETNTLSPVLRNAWDGRKLRTLTKNSPITATDPHVSLIGHITRHELRIELNHVDSTNGFANRFLWICARRSQLLPHGGRIEQEDFSDLDESLQQCIDSAMNLQVCVPRDHEADKLWEKMYPELSADRSGAAGAIVDRAEAQTMRLALVYALLDGQKWIRPVHLHANHALWRYCEASVEFLFGPVEPIDPRADLVKIIQSKGGSITPRGLQRAAAGKYPASDSAERALIDLQQAGLGRFVTTRNGDTGPVERRFVLSSGDTFADFQLENGKPVRRSSE